MKLNADIIFDRLPANLNATMRGHKKKEPLLHRPKLLEAGGKLMSNHLYVVGSELLQRRLEVGQGVVIICIGEAALLDWYEQRACVIRVSASADFSATFNTVQRIFDAYDAWETALNGVLTAEVNIQELLDASSQIFDENPLIVTDANFDFLGFTGEAGGVAVPGGPTPSEEGLSGAQVGSFLTEHDLSFMEQTGPFMLETAGVKSLCVNLIDEESYLGCLTITYQRRDHLAGDDAAAEQLARTLVRALRLLSLIPDESGMLVRQGVEGLIGGRPISLREREELAAASHNRRYVCLRLRLGDALGRMPGAFVCRVVEEAFEHAFAFVFHDSSVVGIVCLDKDDDGSRAQASLIDALGKLRGGGWQAGVSDSFERLDMVRLYFVEASVALEQGARLHAEEQVHAFQDVALAELLSNAGGELPAELYGSPGLRALIAHDKGAPVSYVETLRVYLNHNMSVTAAAQALYVHRSTLIERLGRIRRILGDNLDDPDVRLRLALVLRAMQG